MVDTNWQVTLKECLSKMFNNEIPLCQTATKKMAETALKPYGIPYPCIYNRFGFRIAELVSEKKNITLKRGPKPGQLKCQNQLLQAMVH